jgi:hypothetical protein
MRKGFDVYNLPMVSFKKCAEGLKGIIGQSGCFACIKKDLLVERPDLKKDLT